MSLPSTYQQVEYIQSTGAQYIDVVHNTKNITRITFKVQLFDKQANVIVGNAPSSSNGYYGIRLFSTGGNNLFAGINTSRTQTAGYAPPTTPIEGILDKTKLQIGDKSFDITYANNQVSSGFALMKDKNSNSAKINMYNAKVYESGVLKFNFVPCYRKSDNVIGMYDLVNNVFHANSGSGTFGKGADVNITYKTVVSNAINGYNDIQESLASIHDDIKQPGIGTNMNTVEEMVGAINKSAVIRKGNTIIRKTAGIYDPSTDGGSIG